MLGSEVGASRAPSAVYIFEPSMNRLFLLRHAHRDVQDPADDNGLSTTGRKRAEDLAVWFETLKPAFSGVIWSSPKIRCIETLGPLAQRLSTKIEISPSLTEKQPFEDEKSFFDRVYLWCATLSPGQDSIWCSHGDWLPVALHRLTGRADTFRKGHGFGLNIKGSKPFTNLHIAHLL